MKNKEIVELSVAEIAARKHELREESFHLRIQQQSGQLEKPSTLRAIRREVARLETALTQKTKATATKAAKPAAKAAK
jgi:large subunit ribosomal protein L29